MTLIEFSDFSPLQNLSGVSCFSPDKVYLVGSNVRVLEKRRAALEKVLSRIEPRTVLTMFSVPKYGMQKIIHLLYDICRKESPVVFDVSGGDDYILGAAGAAYERAKSDGFEVYMSHYSVRSGKMVMDVFPAWWNRKQKNIQLTCDEVVSLHGGAIVYVDEKRNGTCVPDFHKDNFGQDLDKLWSLCKADCRTWNKNAARMGELEAFSNASFQRKDLYDLAKHRFLKETTPRVSVSIASLKSSKKAYLIETLRPHLQVLSDLGLIHSYVADGKTISYTYKNEAVRSCLVKAGTVLELFVYRAALDITFKNGAKMYHDARTGVVLDWDGILHAGKNAYLDTENEIDVLLVRGMIPVFVSCKNGSTDENELYKLASVANRFGAKYAKKALIATDLQKNYTSLNHFLARAKAMNITVVDGVHRMTDEKFRRMLASL